MKPVVLDKPISLSSSTSGISVTADKIATILKAAGVSVEPYWPTLFAKALDGIDIGSLLGSLGSAASAVSAGEKLLVGFQSGIGSSGQVDCFYGSLLLCEN